MSASLCQPPDEHRPVRVPPWSDADPYTDSGVLCDDDGIVRSGEMHHGTDYPCTGHAHYGGVHVRCISPGHPGEMPRDLLDLLEGNAYGTRLPGPRGAA